MSEDLARRCQQLYFSSDDTEHVRPSKQRTTR